MAKNKAKKFIPGTSIPKPKIDLGDLDGPDGNSYAILNRCRQVFWYAHVPAEVVQSFLADATAGDYEHLRTVTNNYFDVR